MQYPTTTKTETTAPLDLVPDEIVDVQFREIMERARPCEAFVMGSPCTEQAVAHLWGQCPTDKEITERDMCKRCLLAATDGKCAHGGHDGQPCFTPIKVLVIVPF